MNVTFRDIKADILTKITQGKWAPGSPVPSEVDLAEAYGCARATVNRAMRELVDEGLIERRRKAGTRVRTAPTRQAKFDIPIIRQEIAANNAVYRYALVNRQVLKAPKALQTRWDLAQDAKVLHLTCLHFGDEAPYQFEDRWINLAALPQAEGADFTIVGPNEWLVATVPFSDVEISFAAVAADETVAQHLHCDLDAPLFLTERSTWWDGRAITSVRLFFRPGYSMTTRY